MKKMMVIFLAICLCVSSSACCVKTYTMETFKDNLGDDYTISTVSKLEVGLLLEMMYLDPEDYDIKVCVGAFHKDNDVSVYIIECGSLWKANALGKEVEEWADLNSDQDTEIATKGSFVLFGYERAVNDALN